ncbi:HNH endonuclease family protein [Streptomyces sp. NPDC085460]|uniref:HNH endonuclease family protein n=1 Tax=Streptomyces sp. NPDC085460 TaxID=3365723 RepID=UPI0037D3D213
MIKNLARRSAVLLLALTPLTVTTPALAAQPAAAAPAVAATVLPLADAVDQLPVAIEDRTGYTRDAFKHWNKGLNATDGCHTRNEVLLSEAIESPLVGERCKLTGGKWFSYYDGRTLTDTADVDIDHVVPLAESWDSGASAWTPARREAYANDQDAATSLVAVTDRVNQAKADRDPAEWMPPLPDVHCRYVGEWTATKLRWGLSADQAEADALKVYAEACETTVVHYTPAP